MGSVALTFKERSCAKNCCRVDKTTMLEELKQKMSEGMGGAKEQAVHLWVSVKEKVVDEKVSSESTWFGLGSKSSMDESQVRGALAFYSFLGVAIFLLVGILIYNFVGGKEQMEENSEEEEEEEGEEENSEEGVDSK